MKTIPGFKDYLLGTKQRVWSIRRKRYLKPGTSNSGYKVFCLMKDKVKKMVKRSRLVCIVKYGEIPQGMTVNHMNLNKVDDRPRNLELLTIGDNVRHYVANRRKRKAV